MSNTLQKYYRSEKLFITLPSGTGWYSPDDIEYTSSGEVGVKAMTTRDEMLFKNPDMLLNGEAILRVLRSCVPCVKTPEKLLSNDVDALIVAIRHASFGKTMDVVRGCPNCNHENTYGIDLDGVIGSIEHLADRYIVELPSGIRIHIKPLRLSESFSILEAQFKQQKIINLVDSNEDMTDEEKGKIFKEEFQKMIDMRSRIISDSVFKISHVTDDFEIEERAEIVEFLENTERSVIEEIDKTLKAIAKVGVNGKFEMVCEKCHHTWESEIDFNPVTFFTKS